MLSQTQPWILDADYQALMAMAILEGRQVLEAEIATTTWWKTHNEAQRAYMALSAGDPSEYEAKLDDAKLRVSNMITGAGGGITPDQGIVDYLATQFLMGNMSETQLQEQIRAATDPYSGAVLDPGFAEVLEATEGGLGQTNNAEDEVRSLLNTWLGPEFGNWSDAEIARVAGDIRNDPNAQTDFVEGLKDQRLALLPEYGDRNLSYQAIANTWKQWWIGQWGQNPDESSNLWMTVLKNNDMTESARLLRREGLAQGVEKVTSDLSNDGLRLTGGSERRAI
jgi:hypothetical protein